jgi:hypothetical protein
LLYFLDQELDFNTILNIIVLIPAALPIMWSSMLLYSLTLTESNFDQEKDSQEFNLIDHLLNPDKDYTVSISPEKSISLFIVLNISFNLIISFLVATSPGRIHLDNFIISIFLTSVYWGFIGNIFLNFGVVFIYPVITIVIILSLILTSLNFFSYFDLFRQFSLNLILTFLSSIILSIVTSLIVLLRVDSWILGLIFSYKNIKSQKLVSTKLRLTRNTLLDFPYSTEILVNGLHKDWQVGIENTKQVFVYTFQYLAVLKALKKFFSQTSPEETVYYISKFAEPPYTWQLLGAIGTTILTDKKSFSNLYRFDDTSHYAAAGFWFFHQNKLVKAAEMFAQLLSLSGGREMYIITITLFFFRTSRTVSDIANLKLFPFPKEPMLRPATWEALKILRRIVEDIQVIKFSSSRSARAFALSRAIGELKNLRDRPQTLLQPEREIIRTIILNWSIAILDVASEVGQINITNPVQNPYVIGDPVEGNLFVGREDIIQELEQLWMTSQHLQSVVLYGHRRMGKTSILRNIANRSGAEITVVYINLQRLGTVSEGIGEVLMAISDGISDALQIPPPEDEALLRLPQRTFERYLIQVVREMNQKGLIIALDEFEMIEELIEAGQIPPNFMGVLRGLVQMSSKVAFVFAGLHTLEEMTEDYFQPFFASVIPIRVGFLKPASTRQILANPNDDFLLDYTGEALDLIHHLTAGQPYLVQLVGFLLVRRYNEQVFELGQSRNSTFTVEDVEAIINDSEFFNRGRYYFTGVWNQAAQGSPKQQDILTVLAEYPEGFSIDILRQRTGLDETILNDALNTLKRHDVVCETGNLMKIIVELFRRWVVENFKGN